MSFFENKKFLLDNFTSQLSLINQFSSSNEKFLGNENHNLNDVDFQNDVIDINQRDISNSIDNYYVSSNKDADQTMIIREYKSYKTLINTQIECLLLNKNTQFNLLNFLKTAENQFQAKEDCKKEDIVSSFHIFIQVLNEKDCDYGVCQKTVFEENIFFM